MSLTIARRPLLLLALCMNLVLAACATQTNEKLRRLSRMAPEVLYDDGQRALRSHDWSAAVDIFTALTSRYSLAPEARQARLEIIYAHYKMGEEESARDAADSFIKENPSHPSIDYAYYLKGLVDYERSPYPIETWLGGDPTAKPPQTARASLDAFRTVVTKYPTSLYAADSRRRMIMMRNRLADYELKVAQYYMQRGAWVAAAQRSRQAIEQYDGAPAVKEALRIMIRCYKQLKYDDLADNTLRVFNANYPGESSEWQPQKKGLFSRLFGGRKAAQPASADTR